MRFFATIPCLAMMLCGAQAHEGPEHEIEELTERMQKHGESADLLMERAIEYRVLGKLAEATKDLERAALYDATSIPVHRELSRVLFLTGKLDEALAIAASGLALKTGEAPDLASLRALRAELWLSKKEPKKALEDCDEALRLHARNPEWYLLRSGIHERLKMHKERLAGLEDGITATGAGVLEIERVEAMIDAGQFRAALPLIEAGLNDSRLQSSWLIRRARTFTGLQKKEEAVADLKAALAEIATRLNSKNPDAPLLLDKALALELLGETRDALRVYEDARDKGATDSVNDKIKALKELVPTK